MSAIEIVKEQNPWWDQPGAIDADDDVVAFRTSKFPWVPKFVEQMGFRPAVHSIKGPRRIGKTTLLKYLVRRLISDGVPATKILYVACDGLSGWTELRDVLRTYSDRGVSYFFIDEASFIPEWSRAVKYVYDLGKLKRSFVLVTGSHAMDIMRGVERLPGRRGPEEPGKDFVLLPATFADYVRVVDPKLLEEMKEDDPLLFMEERRSRIFDLFERYLYAGGFPKAQHQCLSRGHVTQEFFDEFLTYLRGDALKEGLDVNVLLVAARRIIETMTVPVSWRSLSNGTGYHHEKVREHVEFLRFSFALEYIYPPKQAKGGRLVPDTGRNRKIYFLDPFVLYSFYSWSFGTRGHRRIAERWLGVPELKGKLLEAVVLRHIIDWTSDSLFSEEIRRDVFYVKTSKRELDFLAVKEDTALAIEVKRRARMGYHFAVADGLVSGKKVLKVLATMGELRAGKGYLEVPIPYLLLLLSEGLIHVLGSHEAKRML